MKILLGIAYDGSLYHGFAKQLHVRTIEEEILKCLDLVELSYKSIRYASRTDKGVSALFQLLQINTKGTIRDLYSFAKIVNSNLPSCIRIHSIAKINEKAHLRDLVKYKEYLYVAMSFGENINKIKFAVQYINSKPHDFSVLSKRSKQRNTIRSVKIHFEESGAFQFFYFRSKGFLWEQVRRTITVIKAFALGRLSFPEFQEILKGIPYKRGISPAPPEPLILWNIKTSIRNWIVVYRLDLLRKLLLNKARKNSIFRCKSWVLP